MEALVMTAQLLLGLSILVGLHEFGHLLAAKAFGMRVEKYSIGFPPKIWGFQYGGCDYRDKSQGSPSCDDLPNKPQDSTMMNKAGDSLNDMCK